MSFVNKNEEDIFAKTLAPMPNRNTRGSLEEIEKISFINFVRQKGNTAGQGLKNCSPASREQGEVLYPLEGLALFSFAKFQNKHSRHHATLRLGVVSLKLSAHDLLFEMQNGTKEYGGEECQVQSTTPMKSESNQL